MAIFNMGLIHTSFAFVGVKFLTNYWFLAHNFGSIYARKSMKGSKYADHNLVSKINLSQKYSSFGWCPGPGKLAKMPSL